MTVPVKPQETTNYELNVTGRATCALVAQTLQSVRQICPCTTATWPYVFVQFPSCGIFTPTRTISSENYELKQQGDGAGEHLNYDKLRVAGHGVGNTRARRGVEFSHQPVLFPVKITS